MGVARAERDRAKGRAVHGLLLGQLPLPSRVHLGAVHAQVQLLHPADDLARLVILCARKSALDLAPGPLNPTGHAHLLGRSTVHAFNAIDA